MILILTISTFVCGFAYGFTFNIKILEILNWAIDG